MPAALTHSVSVLRRTNGSFTPIGVGDAVRPGEAVRYFAQDVMFATVPVEFVVLDAQGEAVFRFEAKSIAFTGKAWVDTAAPSREGPYTLVAHAQTVPFLGFTHEASMPFSVSAAAPGPISPPPRRDLFGSLAKALVALTVGAVAIGAVVVVSKLTPRR